jgi:peptide/nickel transport system permease protein
VRRGAGLGAGWRAFRRNPLALTGALFLIALYALMALADFVAPYAQTATDRAFPFAPPSALELRFEGLRPVVLTYPHRRTFDPETFRDGFEPDRSRPATVRLLAPAEPYRLAGLIPLRTRLFGTEGAARVWLLGTDRFGRDVFSQLLYGSRVSLTIGLIAAAAAMLIGVVLGGVAGYAGGWLDLVIMRLAEALAAIPDLLFLIALRALFPASLDGKTVFAIVAVILAAVNWGGLARVVRGQVLSIREREYVEAARGLGAGHARILGRHVLPGISSYLAVVATLRIPGFILLESGLSFLGLGVSHPDTSWGLMLAAAQEVGYEVFLTRGWLLAPGVLIFATILAWQFVGDGLRDALDPRLR